MKSPDAISSVTDKATCADTSTLPMRVLPPAPGTPFALLFMAGPESIRVARHAGAIGTNRSIPFPGCRPWKPGGITTGDRQRSLVHHDCPANHPGVAAKPFLPIGIGYGGYPRSIVCIALRQYLPRDERLHSQARKVVTRHKSPLAYSLMPSEVTVNWFAEGA
jgi:hypothetical protein